MARVLVIGFCAFPGADRHGVQLGHVVRALASRFAVDVLTLRVGELAYVERVHKTRMLRVPVPEGGLAGRVEAFRRAVRRQLDGAEYDLVHFRDAWAGLPVMERRAALGYRTVFEVSRSVQGELGTEVEPGHLAELAHEETVCWEQADLVLVPTEAGKRFLGQRMAGTPARAERVVVVPPGVDVDRFDVEAAEPPGATPLVVYAGPIGVGRGVRVLLRAFKDVLARTSGRARLQLVGALERDFMDPLGTALDQLGLADAVELVGAVDNEDLPRLLARATVCVAPAAPDLAERPLAGAPTKVLEYLACRRAVVAPRRSSLRELIQDGVEGLLFEPGNPRDLADKIVRVLADPGLRDRVAEAGQRRVRQRFPASTLRRRLLEAYMPILGPSTWAPVAAGVPRLGKPDTGPSPNAASRVVELSDADLRDAHMLADTNPAVSGVGGDFDTGSTVVTTLPDGATGPLLGRAAAADSEAWLVVAGDGSITSPSRARRRAEDTDSGTPSDGLAPPPSPGPLASVFVAGEIDVPESPDAPGAPAGEPALEFVAASELLSGGQDADTGETERPPQEG